MATSRSPRTARGERAPYEEYEVAGPRDRPAPLPRREDFVELSRLGRGSFGQVSLVREKSTGKQFAMKECYKNFIRQSGKAHHIMRERRHLSRINHPLIVRLHASFHDEMSLYFLLEYAANGDLVDQIRRHGCFSDDVTRFYSAEIIVALQYLRSVNIVHRDLKPMNILLDANNHIKITDFGTAHVIGPKYSTYTRDEVGRIQIDPSNRYLEWDTENSLCGTEAYMSPELLDKGVVTYSTDLWSLGCIIFEFHCGSWCFSGGDIHTKIRECRYNYPEGFPKSQDVQQLVAALLRVNPTERLGDEDIQDLMENTFFTPISNNWDNLHLLPPPQFAPPPGWVRAPVMINWDDSDDDYDSY